MKKLFLIAVIVFAGYTGFYQYVALSDSAGVEVLSQQPVSKISNFNTFVSPSDPGSYETGQGLNPGKGTPCILGCSFLRLTNIAKRGIHA